MIRIILINKDHSFTKASSHFLSPFPAPNYTPPVYPPTFTSLAFIPQSYSQPLHNIFQRLFDFRLAFSQLISIYLFSGIDSVFIFLLNSFSSFGDEYRPNSDRLSHQ